MCVCDAYSYNEALGDATACLVDGVERHYIRAVASFRSGDATSAAEHVAEALARNKQSTKCLELKADIERYLEALSDADAALDDERFVDAAERVSQYFEDIGLQGSLMRPTDAMTQVVARACPAPCRAEMLQRRARARMERFELDEAMVDIEDALKYAPGRASCLRVLAALQRRSRDYEACIATLYRLIDTTSPSTTENDALMAEMTEVAALALNERDGPAGRRSGAACKELAAAAGSHYSVLEVAPGAGEEEIRKAYRRLAAVWHPDKQRQQLQRGECTNSGADAHDHNAKFRAIQSAYEVLSDPTARTKYDADVLLKSSSMVV